MLLKKTGFPQEDELVLCTVTNIQYHSVFVVLDEYGKSGMIHISEVSPGRIRNIREYVKEGKKVVCKVMRVHEQKGYIDLSLRRVNESQRRAKLSEVKQEQLAESIIEYIAKKRKINVEAFYKQVGEKLISKYGGLFPVFEQVSLADHDLSIDGLEKTLADELTAIIKARIKSPEVAIHGSLKLMSHEPNGIEIIRESLISNKQEDITIKYLGAGSFGVTITSKDYKIAEGLLDRFVEGVTSFMKKNKSTCEWVRVP
ncbi:MAG: S1 RNA-binding domain-containing protein [Nanoarchaeota archaeon]